MKYVFKSGLKLIHQTRFVDKESAFQVYVNIGSILENPKEKGISHLVEHLIFKSTKKRSTTDIAKELETCGAVINAYTDYDVTCFHFTVLTENFEKCMEIYSDMIFNKEIKQEEFEKEKQVVIQELCMYQDYFDVTNEENFYKEYYKWDPIIGYREILESITLEDVMNFIHKYYVPKNMLISTVSSLPGFIVKKYVKKYFECQNNDGVNTTTQWLQVKYKPVRFNNSIKKVKDNKCTQAQLFMSYEMARNDWLTWLYAKYIAKLCSYGLSSVLFEEVREKEGLCYGIHTQINTYINPFIDAKFPNTFNVAIKTEVKNVKKAINKVDYVMNHLPELIEQTDITKLKNYYKRYDITNADIASYNAAHYYDHKFISYKKYIKICKNMTLKKAKGIIIKTLTKRPKFKAILLGKF